MQEDCLDFYGKVTSVAAKRHATHTDLPYFVVSMFGWPKGPEGKPVDETFYIPLKVSDSQEMVIANALISVASAALCTQDYLQVFLDRSANANAIPNQVDWLQTDYHGKKPPGKA